MNTRMVFAGAGGECCFARSGGMGIVDAWQFLALSRKYFVKNVQTHIVPETKMCYNLVRKV